MSDLPLVLNGKEITLKKWTLGHVMDLEAIQAERERNNQSFGNAELVVFILTSCAVDKDGQELTRDFVKTIPFDEINKASEQLTKHIGLEKVEEDSRKSGETPSPLS